MAVSEDFLRPAVKQAAKDYFDSLQIGEKVYKSALLQYILSVPGVQRATIDALSLSPSVSFSGDLFNSPTNARAILGSGQPSVAFLL